MWLPPLKPDGGVVYEDALGRKWRVTGQATDTKVNVERLDGSDKKVVRWSQVVRFVEIEARVAEKTRPPVEVVRWRRRAA